MKFNILNGECGDVAMPIINDLSLISILKEVELPFAKKEGSPRIAGTYDGLPNSIVFLPSKHFLGEPKAMYFYDGKTSILECECGCEGCWPFLVKIEVDENNVRWSGFEQPHRAEWKYDALGEFVFVRKEYELALARPF
jgi:hypothetical protein